MQMVVHSKDFKVIDKLAELGDIAREDIVHELLYNHAEEICEARGVKKLGYEELANMEEE